MKRTTKNKYMSVFGMLLLIAICLFFGFIIGVLVGGMI
jgi:nitrogen fixation protein FixH